MRAAILIFLTTFWFTAGTAFARNGETGILVVVEKYEFIPDPAHNGYILLLCSEDLDFIRALIKEGYDTKILLKGRGIFEVEETEEGNFRLYDVNVEINSHECHPSTPGC